MKKEKTITFLYCKDCDSTDINNDSFVCNNCRDSKSIVYASVNLDDVIFEEQEE